LKDTIKKLAIGTGLGVASAVFVFFLTKSESLFFKDLFDGYEARSYDARFRVKTADFEEGAIDDVVIVDIDQQSINDLGNYYRWRHTYHGKLIDYISQGNPAAIVFDIQFDPELDPDLDTNFIDATYRSGKTYHALFLSPADTLNFLYPMESAPDGFDPAPHELVLAQDIAARLPSGDRFDNIFISLLNVSRRIGSANFPQDKDGIVRRSPTAIHFSSAGQVYPSLSMAVVMDLLDVTNDGLEYDFPSKVLRMRSRDGQVVREVPIDEHGRMYVNFYGTFKTFMYLPYSFVNPDMLPAEYFENKIVLVGTSLAGLYDLRSVPVQETYPGVEIHANAIYGMLKNEFVQIVPDTNILWAMILMCGILGALMGIPRAVISLPIMVVGIFAWTVYAYYMFISDLTVWEIIRPASSMGFTYIAVALHHFLVIEKDKRFLKNTFGTYISPDLIDQMYKEKQEPQLGGEEGYHTAFFTDIQSFSTFSEKLSATDLVELLNEYLTEMTDILLANKGTLDKYIGDAIVAFYGAPAPIEDHEFHACLTAVKMQKRLEELRNEWESQGDRWPEIVLHMQNRIGINSGPMVTGNMGSSMRMNYTMMGDTVNLASRLEASAKQYGIYVQVAEETYKACADKFIWRDLDYVIVMGKTEPSRVYELIAETGNMLPGYDKLLAAYEEALELYRRQEWDKAIEAFRESDGLEDMFPGRKTNPSRIYIPRCEHFKANPPGDDWDGSWTLTKK